MPYEGFSLRHRLAAKQGSVCTWCELPLPDDLSGTSLDHIIPRSRGGPEDEWNRQVLHQKCNGPSGKGSKLTPEAEALAKEHGIALREPLPTSWPGSNSMDEYGKPNPYRIERDGGPKVHSVTVRRYYEVDCHTCGAVVAAEKTYGDAMDAMREHIAEMQSTHEGAPADLEESA